MVLKGWFREIWRNVVEDSLTENFNPNPKMEKFTFSVLEDDFVWEGVKFV